MRMSEITATSACSARRCRSTMGIRWVLPTSSSPSKTQTTFTGSAPAVRRYASSALDRKSTRLNSSHTVISYAVFCLKHKTELQSHSDLVCRLLLEKKKKKKNKQ